MRFFARLLIIFSTIPFFGYSQSVLFKKISPILKSTVLSNAKIAMTEKPITVTSEQCERSSGGLHDFYSEGDYWWQNPQDPDGPYIQRDGQSNPNNFVAHRKAMIRFSQIVGTLASAYLLTNDEKYVNQAFVHLNAWMVDEETYMNPSLLYAQAIKGKVTGRGTGLIDMIQMIEVAQSVLVIQNAKIVNKQDLAKIKDWFSKYLLWVNSHPYGIEEREAKNNHSTCWVMQVASFAKLTNNQEMLDYCKNRFKTVLLPNQIQNDGSFPLELKRTKPYGYSIFNLDAMTTVCHVLSNEKESLWDFKLEDGRTLKKGIEFLYPFVENKQTWKSPQDVMFWNEWPVAQPFLIFGYQKYKEQKWFKAWKKLEHFPKNDEVIRNLPIRNPLIWLYY